MTKIAVSVIVVSRHRPDALLRCLTGLRQLFYDSFEVIVVADPDGIEALRASNVLADVKHAQFDEANISAARNIGLTLAAGDVVAFIDDDSVPEPTWLDYLIAPFAMESVHAAGGFVRGRNGISFQSKARQVDHLGVHQDITLPDTDPVILDATPGNAIKTEGTNCAFRRDTLVSMGGFDPAFHFYLDETDLNLRLAKQGAKTAIVPLAQVHHGFASSAQRSHQRMPRTLFDVGASLAVFLRKHADPSEIEDALNAMRREQRARLVRHMIAGTCEPADVVRVMRTLELGFTAGASRSFGQNAPIRLKSTPFKGFGIYDPSAATVVVVVRFWLRSSVIEKAKKQVKNGGRVNIFCFTPTALFHRVSFERHGYWLQKGGIFGRSIRRDPLIYRWRFFKRLTREVEYWRAVRRLKRDSEL